MSNIQASKEGNFTFVLVHSSCSSNSDDSIKSGTGNDEYNSLTVLKRTLKEDGCTVAVLEGRCALLLVLLLSIFLRILLLLLFILINFICFVMLGATHAHVFSFSLNDGVVQLTQTCKSLSRAFFHISS